MNLQEIKERPILFSTPMIKALLEGRRTVTRRIIKPQPIQTPGTPVWWLEKEFEGESFIGDEDIRSHLFHNVYGDKGTPYGAVYADGTADRLWVKETWQAYNQAGASYSSLSREEKDQAELYNWAVVSKATNPEDKSPGDPWIPSIFMPRWASAITLEITDVRVEKVQEITEEDARAEGVEPFHLPTGATLYKPAFASLWNEINGPDAWDRNNWVWVISFKLAEAG